MGKTMVKRDNFIVIQGWMVTELGLKGSELMIYACIYGFSQLENQVFSGSLQYLADWTNCTKQGVLKSLKSLIEKGYIGKKEKVINNVKFCEYYATKFNRVVNLVEYPDKQSLPNNIENNIGNNIVISTTRASEESDPNDEEYPPEYYQLSPTTFKPGKGVVILSDYQFDLLCEKVSLDELHIYVEKLADFIIEFTAKNGHPPTIKSHYAKILEWVEEDRKG